MILIGVLSAVGFQNCSNAAFNGTENADLTALKKGGPDEFHTTEDTPLETEFRSAGRIAETETEFQILSQPINGNLTLQDAKLGKFRYVPAKDFTGRDSFTFSEHPEGMDPIVRTAQITVDPANDKPWIDSESFSFEMNSVSNVMNIKVGDIEGSNLEILLSNGPTISSLNTPNGRLVRTGATSIAYTPNANFRGTDKVELFVKDPEGSVNSKVVTIAVGNPFREVQPAMAVRAMGCVSCHANIASTIITDFGYGDPYFFGKRALAKANTSVFSYYSTTTGHSGAYSDHALASWLTSAILAPIIVPAANIGLDLNLQSYTLVNPAAADTEANRRYVNGSIKPGNAILAAATVKDYVTAINNAKPLNQRATGIEQKASIYIGAPDRATIIAKLGLDASTVRFYKNTADSPDLSGLVPATAGSNSYTFGTGKITCDGDVGVKGTLFLKDVTIETKDGCRIYVAGPVIQQGEIKYLNLDQTPSAKNLTNLQIISSEMIMMGIGPVDCESATNPGWYETNRAGHYTPIGVRYGSHSQEIRRVAPGSTESVARLNFLKDFAVSAGLQDASCRGGTNPREVHFERLMLVAPDLQNRYTGQFNGVLIGEFALFALSKFTFKFDDVFKQVPVIPILENSGYLEVK